MPIGQDLLTWQDLLDTKQLVSPPLLSEDSAKAIFVVYVKSYQAQKKTDCKNTN